MTGFYNYKPKDLRCYTCNLGSGYPSCDDPFQLDNSKLVLCDDKRPDNRTEFCAKIYGVILDHGDASDVNATSHGQLLHVNYTHGVNETFFGRGCFPIGDGWIWRREPYNETFIFGNLTVTGSIYVCRNSRCNTGLISSSPPFTLLVILMTLTAILFYNNPVMR